MRGQPHKHSVKALGKEELAFGARGWEAGKRAFPARGCCISTSRDGEKFSRIPVPVLRTIVTHYRARLSLFKIAPRN